jgi:hypothetical protein
MAANHGKALYHYWAGRYGNCGHIYGPGGQRGPFEWLPYGLDNGAFPCWTKGEEWGEEAFCELLTWASEADIPPLWVAVPDVVADAPATLAKWGPWSRIIRDGGFKAALVVQDGMSVADALACEPDALFVGGTTGWKELWLHRWCDAHEHVHVGRVNGYRMLVNCYRAGAESCDGTGWFRGNQGQLAMLERFLREQAEGRVPEDVTMFDEVTP